MRRFLTVNTSAVFHNTNCGHAKTVPNGSDGVVFIRKSCMFLARKKNFCNSVNVSKFFYSVTTYYYNHNTFLFFPLSLKRVEILFEVAFLQLQFQEKWVRDLLYQVLGKFYRTFKKEFQQNYTGNYSMWISGKHFRRLHERDAPTKNISIPSIRNRVLCSGMLLYLHLISNKIFFHPAKFDNFKDQTISDYKTVSVP